MKHLLNEIKQLAHQGYETAILNAESESKKVFWQIIEKIEFAPKTEVVEVGAKQPKKYDRHSDEARDNMYLTMFCFSYYGHETLYPNLTQYEAFNRVSEKLGIKFASLKNTRDLFDGHNNNSRVGWKNSPLPERVRKAKEYLESLGEKTVVEKAKKVLEL